MVETFRQNVRDKQPHKVNKPGTQTRAFTHVLDTVSGLVLIGEKGNKDEYDICADDVHSIKSVAELFGGDIVMHPQTKTSRSSVASDTTDLRKLGWKQEYDLKSYIEESKNNL